MSFNRLSLNQVDRMAMYCVRPMTLLLIFGTLFFAFWTPNLSYVELLQPGTEDELVPPRAASNFTSTANNSTSCSPVGNSC
jgi:hypothetical protein